MANKSINRTVSTANRVSDRAKTKKLVIPPVQSDPLRNKLGRSNAKRTYRVTKVSISKNQRGTLVDRGANGGILGNDAHVILQHQQEVDVTGIDNHAMTGLKIVNASATAISNRGKVILIFNQYAYHGRDRSIHSCGQIEYYNNHVDDRSMKVGGKQFIKTNDGYIFPLDIINGLPYLKMRPNTPAEWDTLPHIIMTEDKDWNPSVIDNVLSDRRIGLIISKISKMIR